MPYICYPIYLLYIVPQMIGLANQRAPACDLQLGNASRNSLFTNADGHGRPGDLAARNIQRGRDHGIPGYDKLREACGMTDIIGGKAPKEISDGNWKKLLAMYNNDPSQMDGFTAGLAENAAADGMVSATYNIVISLTRWDPSLPVSLRSSLRIFGMETDSSSATRGAAVIFFRECRILRGFLGSRRATFWKAVSGQFFAQTWIRLSFNPKSLGKMFSKLSRGQIQSLIAITSDWGGRNWILQRFSWKSYQRKRIS